MLHYVYIIQSQSDGSYYKGYTLDPAVRLTQHNNGESTYTRQKLPWTLIHLEIFDQKKEALIRERVLKKYSHAQIEALIKTSLNKVKDYRS